ncbi:DUF881 domain-containing protein [Metabacillus sp. RGM 3146]|uniref:DUF881 domain-containing protein n=1 Tax=Metabacillus sp. RGM 3146 TaxID=3401092 RepID=UPI003B9D011E
MKPRVKYIILSLVMLVLGFLISFSYQLTNERKQGHNLSSDQWKEEYKAREQLIGQEDQNKKFQRELFEKQEKAREIEDNLKNEKKSYSSLVENVNKYRMYTGETGVKGQGVQVTLDDASYVPEGENVNNYIVHEGHVFKVINELLISGASAVSINGQRIFSDSYIFCNGPVITVDGSQYPAPFVISAIGDPDTLTKALNISGGVVEQLAYDNVVVTVQHKDINMEPVLQEDRSS